VIEALCDFCLARSERPGGVGLPPPPPLSSDSEELSCNVDVLLLDDFKDEILTSLPLYRVLKIDVEGADTWVIEGAHSLLRQKVFQHIFFECNRPRMRSLGISEYLAHQILQDCGFKIKPLTNPNRQVCEYHAYCH
jgi:hypothetical protein